MKIAFLNDGVFAYATRAPSATGGAERDQWILARALVAAGWSATVGVREFLNVGERKLIDGVEYVGIGQGQILLAWQKFLLRERPNWLFWECAYHLWGPLVEMAKFAGVRTIFHVAHDTDVEPRKALAWRPGWWPLYAWGLFRTDIIFVQHTGQLSKLNSRWQSKASVLPKICLLPGVLGLDAIVKPHAERKRYVAWVGMMKQHKRPDVLVEIARNAPKVHFIVCGGPAEWNYYETIVNELRVLPNVEFLGQVAPEKAHQIIGDAAILLSTSDEEGFPNVFTQAWSSGTPVVSLKIDPDGIIKGAGLGTVSGNIERAIYDITALINSPERRDEIAMLARKHIVDNNGATAVIKSFENALASIS